MIKTFEKQDFICAKCSNNLFLVRKGYYSKNPLLECNSCHVIMTLKELRKYNLKLKPNSGAGGK